MRALAENNVPLAHEKAQRLQADLSADATPADKAKILNLLARVEAYMALTAQAEKHARLALEMSEQNADKVGQVEALLTLTLTSTNQAKIDMLTDAASRSVALLDGIDRPDLQGEAMSRLAMTYLRTGALEESIAVAMQAMEIAKRNNDPTALAYAHWGLAAIRESGESAADTRAHYVQMREQARAAHSRLMEAIAMQGIADVDGRLGDSAGAERLLRESITVFREIGVPFGLNSSLHNLAYLFLNQGQHAKAIPLLDEVIASYGKYPNPIGLWYALISRSTSLQMSGHIAGARADAAKAYALAKEIGLIPYLSESLRRMAALALAAGETKRVYDLFLEVNKLDAKALQQKNAVRILTLTQRYESDSAKRQLDEVNQRNELLWMVLGELGAVLAVTAFFLFYRQRARTEIELLNANRVQREALLQKSEAEFRSLAENAVDKIARFDRQCRVLYLNPVLEASLKLSTADMLGKGADFFENGRLDDLEIAIKQVIASGKNTDYYFTSRDTGTGERHYQARIVPEWADGEVVGALAIGRDISELKKAEAALRANEERMRLFFEHQMVGTAITSPEKGWLHVNEKLCAMLGYTRDELRLLSWVELTHPDDLAADEAQFNRLLGGEIDSYMLEKRFVRKDGGIVHTNLGVDCVRRADRSVDYVLAVLEDISDRKRMELELREQKDFQQILLNALKEVGIQLMVVENGRITYIMDHQTFLDNGHTQEEINAGLTLLDIIHPEDIARVMDTHARRLAGEPVPSSYELTLVSRNGVRLEYEISVAIVPGTNPVRIITVGKDITERKRAEQKLKESLEFSQGIINAIPDILFEVDSEGRYLNLWTHTPELLAAQKEALLGNTFFDVLSPESASVAMDALREAEETGLSFGKVIHIDLPQGERWFELSVSKKNASSPINSTFLTLSHDITERREAQKQLESRNLELLMYREKLEQRVTERTIELNSSNSQLRIEIGERKKTEDELRESREQLRGLMVRHEDVREEERKFIARELHDELGQIMTALKLNVQMLSGNIGENLPSLHKQALQAEAAVVEAMGVVRSLSSSLRPVELDMGIISALEWTVKRFATFTHIECSLHIEHGEINLDEPRAIALFRIVQESLTNVAKHAQASRVDITLARDADDYVLKVRDNGKGFDASTKKAGSFGLVGIRERVHMLGGTVAIDSRSKMGTEIVVRIPSGEKHDSSVNSR